MKSLSLKLSRRPRLFFFREVKQNLSILQMSKPNIESEVQKGLKDLMHIRSRVVPVKLFIHRGPLGSKGEGGNPYGVCAVALI